MPKKHKDNFWTGPGKHWDVEDHVIGRPGLFRKVNENRWFKQQQELLLWMANTPYGRDLLCIPKHFPKITEISKKHITGVLDVKKVGNQYIVQKLSDFRPGAKYGNVIRHRWQLFQEYAQEYYRVKEPFFRKFPILFPVTPYAGMPCYTVTTVYPDPDPETSTVDGPVGNDIAPSTDTWANIRGGTGTLNAGPSVTTQDPNVGYSQGATNWKWMYRSIYLWDTSSIPDTDTIDSATLSPFGAGTKRETLASQEIVPVTSTPASNTDLVGADFNQLGTVAQAPVITVASYSTTAYNDFTLNATGRGNISKTGISKFGTRMEGDRADAEPAASNSAASVDGNYAEATGTGNDPKLAVTHSAAAAGGAPLIMMMGVGM